MSPSDVFLGICTTRIEAFILACPSPQGQADAKAVLAELKQLHKTGRPLSLRFNGNQFYVALARANADRNKVAA